MKKVIMIVNF